MNEQIRIMVVDDHPLFREGVVQTLTLKREFQVVGEAERGEEAVRLAAELLPDILLLDIGIPGGGIATAARVAGLCPATKIVMLTVSEDEKDLLAALKAGARGYILKGISGRELMRILQEVAAGDVYLPPGLASNVLVEMADVREDFAEPSEPLLQLTTREREILELVAVGASNKEIGDNLFLSEKTVKHYMTNILQKLQVRNRVEAALLAQRARLEDSRQGSGLSGQSLQGSIQED